MKLTRVSKHFGHQQLQMSANNSLDPFISF